MKYKHFIFDMDGTICESRQIISDNMAATLSTLRSLGNDVVVISGAEKERIKKQLGYCTVNYILAQSGSDSPFWKKKIHEKDEIEVWKHIKQIQKIFKEFNWGEGVDDKKFVENRGCQITFCLTSFDYDTEKKKQFDPTGRRRKSILENIPFFSINMECRVAGSASLDYTYKEYTKGKNIERLIKYKGWKKEECVYFGDKLCPGGNDETVKGIIDCFEVKNPDHCLDIIKELTS